MRTVLRLARSLALVSVTAALSLPMFAATEKASPPIGRPAGGGATIEWMVTVTGHDSITLTVVNPEGDLVLMKRFNAGRSPHVRLQDLGSGPLDGIYTYEMRVAPKVNPAVAAAMKAAREAGDDAAAKKIMKEAGLTNAIVQSGTFAVVNGFIVSPDAEEPSARDAASIGRSVTTDAGRPPFQPQTDQVIADNLIVQGSLCVGVDCLNNESFGFDTIRMKENNLRVKFDDTSSIAGYPANDWQLTANDSASGGANKFSIEDVTNTKVPFTVTGGAATNSIFVDSTGRVGFKTATPVLDLSINTSNTPSIRLEQNNSGGWTAQTWDIGGNEANFFVRDVTGGSRLPLRIRPGAPTSSIDVAATGNVGVGTASPTERLHVFNSTDANIFSMVENPNTGINAAAVLSARSDTARWDVKAHASTRTATRFGVTLGGWTEVSAVTGNGLILGTAVAAPVILGVNSTDNLHIDTGGDVGINCNNPGSDLVIASGGGCANPSSSINAGSTQFTAASSRTFKEHIEPVSVPNILDTIEEIGVYRYDFINGPKDRIGLISEDFHRVFGRGSEQYIDGGEVQIALWLAVQQLTERNHELLQRIETLEKQRDGK